MTSRALASLLVCDGDAAQPARQLCSPKHNGCKEARKRSDVKRWQSKCQTDTQVAKTARRTRVRYTLSYRYFTASRCVRTPLPPFQKAAGVRHRPVQLRCASVKPASASDRVPPKRQTPREAPDFRKSKIRELDIAPCAPRK